MQAEWITWMKDNEPDLHDEYIDSVISARQRLYGYKLYLELKDIDTEWSERIERMIQAENKEAYIIAMES